MRQPAKPRPGTAKPPAPPAGDYTIRRNRQAKRLKLKAHADGRVEVVVPWRAKVTAKEIDAFVKANAAWLETARKRLRVDEHLPFAKRMSVLWRGKPTPLTIEVGGDDATVVLDGAGFRISAPTEAELHLAFMNWAVEQCLALFPAVLNVRSREMGLTPTRVTIRNQQTRWGSCSSSGNLNMSWRLALAPPEVLDAVAVHELAHRFHLDHSPSFYAVVEKYCPDYNRHHRWLREHAAELRI